MKPLEFLEKVKRCGAFNSDFGAYAPGTDDRIYPHIFPQKTGIYPQQSSGNFVSLYDIL